MKMRVDKFLTATATATRSEAAKAAKQGRILVNGTVCKSTSMQINPETDKIMFDGEEVIYQKYIYIMLNKPTGYVSATDDGKEKTVLDLLPQKFRTMGLFPCGRLDKNTVGLMLLTNNGELGHKLLSPKYHVSKIYRYGAEKPLSDEDVNRLENGVSILGGYITKPAKVTLDADRTNGEICITEGKYHQIKLMFEAVDNKIVFLERVVFGPLVKDENLARGEWRHLTKEEKTKLESHCNYEENT